MSTALARLRERPATLLVVVLGVLAVWEVATLWQVHAAAPDDNDWRAAAAHVDGAFRPGEDLVVFAPTWVDPVGRQWLGHRLTLDDLGRADASGYARVWEVSIRDAVAPEVAGLHLAEAKDFGGVRVRRFEQTPITPSFRFPAKGSGDLFEVGHQPRRCARLMGRRDFSQVTLGSELVVYAGLADVWARKENRAFARIRVLVDGQELGATSIGNHTPWRPLRVTTTPGLHDVTLDVSVDPSRGDAKKQRLEVCLVAEGRSS
jgi:hypothetical protein